MLNKPVESLPNRAQRPPVGSILAARPPKTRQDGIKPAVSTLRQGRR